ncbi:hypothetical protein Tco_0985516 [Tanacetum coccineum]
MIDSQMDDMIREKLALKEQVDSLERNLSKQIKEKESQRIKPTLYDGIVMSDKNVAMPVIDDEETLILEEKSRSKMSEKAKDPEIIDKNISHKPIDYEKLNRLSEDFGKRFTLQQEMDAEQVFWLRISNPTSKPSDASPVKIEAPKELPKVSLVNKSLKKLKVHLARFDNVAKIRTTPDARTEGEWGFEHTKAVFNKEIIPFLKSLKDIFNVFDRYLLNEIMEVHTVFNQMDTAVQQFLVDKQYGKIKETCNLEAELLKSQNAFNNLLKRYSQLEKYCISLEASIQLNQEIFQKDESCNNQNALEIPEFFEKNDLKAQLQDKDTTISQIQDKVFVITSLKNDLRNLKGKEIVDIAAQTLSAHTIVPGKFKLDLEHLAPRLLQNREMQISYLKHTQEQADILQGLVKQAKAKQPLDKELDFALRKRLLSHPKIMSRKLGSKCSTSKCESKLTGNKRNDRISQTPSRNMKNKVEAQPRKVNKKNRVVEPICDDSVKHSKLNVNSDLNCATCKKSLFDDVYDKCLLDFVKTVNSHPKSTKKHKKQNIWKPTANVVPPKKTTSHLVETQKPELKIYSRKPKNIKNVGSSKKAKIIESKNANHSEPNHTWGSTATDIPSSSSLVMTCCLDCTFRFGNDHIARIMGYGDYQLGNVTISRVYYVEGFGHNLFSVGQFCDGDLEVAFQKNTCFIRNLECVDLLSGSRDTNLYIISLDDMLKTSPICLLSKASKTKS